MEVEHFFNPTGARWWKVDFHSHSPTSFDFGASEGSKSEFKTSHRDWLLAYMRSEIDAIVITDHNSHAGIDLARTELKLMRESHAPGFRELALFAGVELTVDGGYHLLAVFDVDTKSSVVDYLINVCGYEAERGDSLGTTKMSFSECVDAIVAKGGLAIPAHIDAAAGLFGHDERSQMALFDSGKILAAEVVTEDGQEKAKKFRWISVLGSDSHHLDGKDCPEGIEAKYPGSHFTWVKMETPNLLGLKVALSDGEDSVILGRFGDQDRNLQLHTVIKKVSILHDGVGTEYEFGPWMNAIIGGRGVGKSTIIEVIRLAMGRFTDLPVELQSDNAWFSPAVATNSTPRFWNVSTEIHVHLTQNNRDYRVLWLGAVPESSKIEIWGEGEWSSEVGNPRDRFNLLINSQKQIYATARDPQSLLRALDEQPSVGYGSWKVSFGTLCDSFRTQRAELKELLNRIATEDQVRGEVADIDAELEQLAKHQHSKEAQELEKLLGEKLVTQGIEKTACRFENSLQKILEEYTETELGAGGELSLGSAQATTWEAEWKRRNAINQSRKTVADALEALTESRRTWESISDRSPRSLRISELSERLQPDEPQDQELLSNGLTNIATDPTSVRVRLLERRSACEAALADIEKAKTRQLKLATDTAETLESIAGKRAELSSRRSDLANSLSNARLKLQILTQADDKEIESELRRLTQKSTSFDPVFDGLISVLGHAFYPKRENRVGTLKKLLKELRSDGLTSILVKECQKLAIDPRFLTHLNTLDEHSFTTEIDLWFPEDKIQVQYRQNDSDQFQEIDKGSPGQKTAALLAVVLELNEDPLLLDQPEDDLDNKLIYELVVDTLRRIKSKRQVIVVTHNANVVVNGNAEHVTILTHGSVPQVEASRAIQNEEIKESICLIMEGGKSAFEARYSKLMQ